MDKWADKDYASRRAYDAELALTIGGFTLMGDYDISTDGGFMLRLLIDDGEIPHYSSSVDAALTLVPDPSRIRLSGGARQGWECHLTKGARNFQRVGRNARFGYLQSGTALVFTTNSQLLNAQARQSRLYYRHQSHAIRPLHSYDTIQRAARQTNGVEAMSDNTHITIEMPVCTCGNRLTFIAIQSFAPYPLPDKHYCECHTDGCQWNNGSTYTAEGWREYLARYGVSDAQYDDLQHKA